MSLTQSAQVTVLLSTYNGSRFLQEQLDSLYKQTYADIKILVRDDGSSDATRAILQQEANKGRIEILEGHDNLGPACSFFTLLSAAALTSTKYVAFCDQDDIWHPKKIENAVSSLYRGEGTMPKLYCSIAEIVDEHMTHIGYTEFPRSIGFGNALVENIAIGCTMVMNRQAIILICQKLPERVMIHDWWCYLVVSCFGEVIFSEQADIKYRQHGNNTIGISSNIYARYQKKISRFFGRGKWPQWISEQAAALQDIYQERIPEPHGQVLERFFYAKSSFWGRVHFACSSVVWRQKWSDNILMKMLILLNRV